MNYDEINSQIDFMEEREASCIDKDHLEYIERILLVLRKKINSHNFKIPDGDFSAVSDQNNGNCSILKKGLSAVPVPKHGTEVADKVGFSVVPKSLHGYFEIINTEF